MGIAKSYRIKKEMDFQNVFDQHNSVANHQFIIYQYRNQDNQHFRVGLSVGKKVGKAHERVWVKRRIRQAIYQDAQKFPNDLDILVIARPSTKMISQAEAIKSLNSLFLKAKIYD